jgi:hypothetical protein
MMPWRAEVVAAAAFAAVVEVRGPRMSEAADACTADMPGGHVQAIRLPVVLADQATP